MNVVDKDTFFNDYILYQSHLQSSFKFWNQKVFLMEQDINKNYFTEQIKKNNPTIFDVGTFDGSDCLEFLELFKNPNIYVEGFKVC